MRKRYFYILAFLALLCVLVPLLLFLSCQRGIQRATAEALIRASDFMAEVETVDLTLYENYIRPASDLLREHSEVQPFVAKGFVEAVPRRFIFGGELGAKFQLTAKGQAASAGWERGANARGELTWKVPVAKRELIAAEEPSTNENTAECRFSWRSVPTDVGRAIGRKLTPHAGQAYFQRVGETWELIRATGE